MLSKLVLLLALIAPAEALVVGAARLAPAQGALRAPLAGVRAQEAPPPPPGSRLGGTVDQDGKSNVWVRLACGRDASVREPLGSRF